MKIKHKRLIIIECCIAWGIISVSYFFFWAESGTVSYWYILCEISTLLAEPIFKIIGIYSPYWFVVGLYFLIQSVIYFILGSIIARLVYPNKKALTESDKPSETSQD